MVPLPADGVADMVGGVSVLRYGPLSPERESVRVSAEMVKLAELEVADA
jgi:hypothetical protein